MGASGEGSGVTVGDYGRGSSVRNGSTVRTFWDGSKGPVWNGGLSGTMKILRRGRVGTMRICGRSHMRNSGRRGAIGIL